ncbi:MAG: hypothetical protein SGJ24_18280 [Chloroflexota bacterium]|nr:hypothetical protein [Chloroflexota bacterium]
MLTEIIHHPNFVHTSVVLRFILTRTDWRKRHPVAFAKLLAAETHLFSVAFADMWSSDLVLDRALQFVNTIQTELESDISLSTDDIRWLVDVIGSDKGSVTIPMLLAFSRAIDDWYTPAQLAETTGEGSSTWRKRAVEDQRLMAQKHGKQWVIPAAGLILAGYQPPPIDDDDEDSSED